MNIIIILNYNDFNTTHDFLLSIKNYKVIDKIIVVDNNSSDYSYEKLKVLENDKIDIIKNEKNNGYSGGNNYGIKFAEKFYCPKNIIISNPDIEVTEETIQNLIYELDCNDMLAVVTGVMYENDTKIMRNFAWHLPKYHDILCICFSILNKLYRDVFKISELYNIDDIIDKEAIDVDVVPGCFFIIKDRILQEIGYLDEDVFLFYEENILGQKLKKLNYQSRILCNQKIKHFCSISINKNIKSWKKRESIYRDSTIVYLKKYLDVSNLQIYIFKLLFLFGEYEKRIIGKIRTWK